MFNPGALIPRQGGQMQRVPSNLPSSYTASQGTYRSRGRSPRTDYEYSYYGDEGRFSGEQTSVFDLDAEVRDARAEVAGVEAQLRSRKGELTNTEKEVTTLKNIMRDRRRAHQYSERYRLACGAMKTASKAVKDLKRDLANAKAEQRRAEAERNMASAARVSRSQSPLKQRDARAYSPQAPQQHIRYKSPSRLYGAGVSTRQSSPETSTATPSTTAEIPRRSLQLPYRSASQTQSSLYDQPNRGRSGSPSQKSDAGGNASAYAYDYASDRSRTLTSGARSKGKAPMRHNPAINQDTLDRASEEAYNLSRERLKGYSNASLAVVAEALFQMHHKRFSGSSHSYQDSRRWSKVSALLESYQYAGKHDKHETRTEVIGSLRKTFAASEDCTTSEEATRYGIACAITRLLDDIQGSR